MNHCAVYELLLEFAHVGDWTKALLKVLPPRKGFVPKDGVVGDADGDVQMREPSTPSESIAGPADALSNVSNDSVDG